MIRWSRAVFLLAAVSVALAATDAGPQSAAERAYFRAVSRYFELPEAELAILASWEVPADEIPVVLFMARRAGVSAEALVALRESGRSWTELADRYQVGARALHVPIQDPAAAGRLTSLYGTFADMPVDRWGDIQLSSEDIVALVNVRVLSQVLGIRPDDIMRRTANTSSFVELYAQLIR